MTETVAPALSTAQDAGDFEFAKVNKTSTARAYLGQISDNSESTLKQLLAQYYSVTDLVRFLQDKKFRRIALQFPDSLVADSPIVLQLVQQHLDKLPRDPGHVPSAQDIESVKVCSGKCGGDCKNRPDVWILADTSYSPCCIDEVAAEHVSADLVVHFGDACLNPVDKLSAAYVFGKPFLDKEKVVEAFKATYSPDDKVILMADAPYTSHLYDIYEQLSPEYNVGYAELDLERSKAAIIDQTVHNSEGTHLASRIIHFDGPLDECSLFHITKPEDPRLLYLSTQFSSMTIYDVDSASVSSGPFPTLMKRYRAMHMARSAGTVGILINTLSLSNTRTLLNKVIRWVRGAGKKHYMFVVGKPNVAKLANFESVDVWCIIGCGQSGIILDTYGEYYKNIITPYELQLALKQEITWTGQWITDFEAVLDQEEEEQEEQDGEEEEYVPEFNPVTGQLASSRPLRQIKHLEVELGSTDSSTDGQLVARFSNTLSIKNTVSTSASYLQSREWTGLGSDFGQDELEGAELEEGRLGIARGYDYDKGQQVEKNN
ncbi:hypothetical protein OGAPHI_001893 [Ogataea philodendri]|uniref:2-(3-amino-3-carboxypropyl)histidine synthase subunit 2 n=1 Tax=Ogataea philodendri TaxID=1378263 RepID=A0A9P8PAY1_9ASCO|nr:uncharacterized protein OGAPHI_001893 [Ogataea philodendri]KAH3668139.1 hypothetical protein OGAPHI_001893 [Ogataea philodendri]